MHSVQEVDTGSNAHGTSQSVVVIHAGTESADQHDVGPHGDSWHPGKAPPGEGEFLRDVLDGHGELEEEGEDKPDTGSHSQSPAACAAVPVDGET